MIRRADRAEAPLGLILAPMRTKDLAGVLRIEQASFDVPWSRRLFVEELAQRSRVYRVAWRGRRIVGFGGLMLVDDEGHVNNIAVDPELVRAAASAARYFPTWPGGPWTGRLVTSRSRCEPTTSPPSPSTPGSGSPLWVCVPGTTQGARMPSSCGPGTSTAPPIRSG